MTTFPGSPRLLKGAIVAIDSTTGRIVNTIAFQYNPETLTRKLQPRFTTSDQAARTEALRLEGAPIETIDLKVELDAIDGLEKAERNAVELGIYPQLSALEMLVYPRSSQIDTNMKQAENGVIEVIPIEAPMTLLVWGSKRVLPVRIMTFSIAEEAYDVNLNPIRAEVTLSLKVLSYTDLPWGQRGAKLFLAHHKAKERMAGRNGVGDLASLTGVNEARLRG